MPPKMKLKNPEALTKAFKQLDELTQASSLEAAVTAGLQPIINAAIEKAPYKTGTYRRSLHGEIIESRKNYCEGAAGTDVPYARRIEFGFQGLDALGREYHQPARPVLRPAFDENRSRAVAEMGDALKDILTALI